MINHGRVSGLPKKLTSAYLNVHSSYHMMASVLDGHRFMISCVAELTQLLQDSLETSPRHRLSKDNELHHHGFSTDLPTRATPYVAVESWVAGFGFRRMMVGWVTI
ncbi:hypothetical protein CFP56_016135 [Quercus suber]|uniref:Uncharacterized protein n=1 Tax=Quercus suber TaxID=58331 RepID=A0AAW0KQ65_QUESU